MKSIKRIVIVLVAIIFLGVITENIFKHLDTEKFKPIGKTVEANGSKMHVYSKGSGENTVVFAAGFGEFSPYVSFYPLHNEISKNNRVVVYDKPGYGWSDTTNSKRDIDIITEEIHSALINAGEKPPYIFVAHSMGALEAIRFAQLHKDEVKGIVLIDGRNPELYSIISKVSVIAELRVTLFHKLVEFSNIIGLSRLVLSVPDLYSEKIFVDKNKLSLVSEDLKDLDKAMFLKTMNNKNQIEEGDMREYNSTKVLAGGKLGDIPIVIFTSEETSKYKELSEAQVKLKDWSSNSKQIIVEGSKHYIHWYNPEIINQEISSLSEQKK